MLNSNTALKGRIERIQIQRSDGSIRESRKVNISNTVVNSGLKSLLMVNDDPYAWIDITNNNAKIYADCQWVRALYFMQIGRSNQPTAVEMTELVDPYINDSNETFSASHYIPVTADLSIRGTTSDACAANDIRWTHRITSNSIKATEDNVEINEIGFFYAYNNSYGTAWTSQVWNVGSLFSRINLGDNKIVLNKGERVVITYAITEYLTSATHYTINNIHLKDENDKDIVITTEDGEYVYGAIARAAFGSGVGKVRCGISTTSDTGYTTTEFGESGGYTCIYRYPSFCNCRGDRSGVYSDRHYIYNPSLVGTDPVLTKRGHKLDSYGFTMIDNSNAPVGCCLTGVAKEPLLLLQSSVNSSVNPYPRNNSIYNDLFSFFWSTPAWGGLPYTINHGDDFIERKLVIPLYAPYATKECGTGSYNVSTLDPSNIDKIYWLVTMGMIFKFGYYKAGGNLNDFVQYPIYKKAGQYMEFIIRESYSRYNNIKTVSE